MQKSLPVAVNQGAGRDHLGVQQSLLCQQAPEVPAVMVTPIHHRGYRELPI